MKDNKIYLGKTMGWGFSEFYFDGEKGEFIEEKYHEEYLDTGTIFDGSEVVSAQHIYDVFVENMNRSGIEKLFEFCDVEQIYKTSDKGISEKEFREKISEMFNSSGCSLIKIDDLYLIRDEKYNIRCVLSKAKYFYAYVDFHLSSCGKGFKTQGEAFAYALKCLEDYYERQNKETEDRTTNQAKSKEIEPERIKKSNKIMVLEKVKIISSKIALISFFVILLMFCVAQNVSGIAAEVFAGVYIISAVCFVPSLIALIISVFALHSEK